MAKPTIDQTKTWAQIMAETVGDATMSRLFEEEKSDRNSFPASQSVNRSTDWYTDRVDAFVKALWQRTDNVRGVVREVDGEAYIYFAADPGEDTEGDKRIGRAADGDLYVEHFDGDEWVSIALFDGTQIYVLLSLAVDGPLNAYGVLNAHGGIDSNGEQITSNGGNMSTNGGDFSTVGGDITTVGGNIVGNRITAGTTTNAGRGSAATAGVGAMIWNSDDNAPNWSDGTNWRDAAGNVT